VSIQAALQQSGLVQTFTAGSAPLDERQFVDFWYLFRHIQHSNTIGLIALVSASVGSRNVI